MRLIPLLALFLASCAAPCKQVKNSRAAFEARTAAAESPHLAMSVPFAVVDQLVAAQLKRLKPLRMRMPEIAGLSTGTLTVRVERVRAKKAPPGRLRFAITVGLSSGKRKVMNLDIDVVVTPQIDAPNHEVVIAVSGKNVQSIKPRLDQNANRQLADFIWSQLPSAARMLTSKKQIAAMASGLSDELMQQAFALVKRELLDDLGEITRIELELPDLPLRRVEVQTQKRYLVLGVYTSLPVEKGVGDVLGRKKGMHENLVQLRIPGHAAAEFGNYAMELGEIPERWTLEGEASEDGPLFAALGWNDDGKKPLAVHLWSLEKDCAHVELGATPTVAVSDRHIVLQTNDAKIEKVEGPLKVRAGIWFSGLGRRSFSFVEQTAANMEFEVGGQRLSARVHSAKLQGGELVLGLKLDKARKKRK
jgi:hypothetical protein